jgi:membrane dipeptidase
MPNEKGKQKTKALHEQTLVIAGHTDIVVDIADQRSRGERTVFLQRHLPILKKGGVTAVCEHVGGDTPYFSRFPFRSDQPVEPVISALKGVEALYAEVEESEGALCIATCAKEIEEAKQRGQVAIVLCFEGGMPLGEDLTLLHIFYQLGVRMIGLTHNLRNLIGDGIGVRKAGGLTDLGIAMVEEMNRLGVVVDVSHLSERGFWDVVKVSRQPIIASHSNCHALVPHPRNLKDDQIQAIARNSGVIGVHALWMLVSGKREATLDNLLDHIDHLRNVAGIEHIAIGPDLLEECYPRQLLYDLWAGTSMSDLEFIYPDGFRSLADLPNITQGLLGRGYSEREVKLIMGENLLRVGRQVWGA